MTRLQELGIDRLPPAERLALARELLASVGADPAIVPTPPPRIPADGFARSVVRPPAPTDDWERRLFAVVVDCGYGVPDAALSSDGLYD